MKNVKGFEGYFVNDKGEVFSNKRGGLKKLKTQSNVDGYNVVNLYKGGKYHHKRVARLVAEAYLPNPLDLPVVNHIDQGRTDDSLDNLEWCTVQQNSQYSIAKHPERWKALAKITTEQAHDVCRMISEGARNKEIVEGLDVPLDTVKHIRNGKTWKEVSSNYFMRPSKRGVSSETVRWICNRILEGLSNREIVEQSTSTGVTVVIVKHIRNKDTWVDISNEYF